MVAVYFLVNSSAVQVVLSLVVLMAVFGVARLPRKPRQIVTAVAIAVLGAGVGVALAVPYNFCDPLWRWMGWC